MKKITTLIASAVLLSAGFNAQNNGAILLKDVNSTLTGLGSNPSAGVAVGNTYFFAASNDKGRELYKSDGTIGGTVLVKDIYYGGNSNPRNFIVAGTTVFFLANNGNGEELWRTDGTSAGTQMLDIDPSNTLDPWGYNYPMAVLGSSVYFNAFSSTYGYELWKSDGTDAGTVIVKDIEAGGYWGWSYPSQLTTLNTDIYFQAFNSTYGYELWKTDGSSAGTVLVNDIYPAGNSYPQNLRATGSMLYFWADSPGYGYELWKSDGSSAGTELVKDIEPGAGNGMDNTQFYTVAGSNLFFSKLTAAEGAELWKSDGTSLGTDIFADVNPGNPSSNPSDLVALGTTLYLSFDNHPTDNQRLFKTDGTTTGIVLVSSECSDIQSYVTTSSMLYFSAADINGYELWKSDGTSANTVMVKDINVGGSSQPQAFGIVGSQVFFKADDGTNGPELWTSNGLSAGTMMLQIGTGLTNSGNVDYVTKSGNNLFFMADDGVNGYELWTSDGTASGSELVKDLNPGTGNFNMYGMVTVGDDVYFYGDDFTNGLELWKTNGTSAGTNIIDLNPGAGSSDLPGSGIIGNTLYFTGDLSSSGVYDLYTTDGTTAGTDLIYAGFSSVNGNMTEIDGKLYFAAEEGGNGTELWVTDGTSAGTMMVKDINPAGGHSNPYNFVAIGSTIYFFADNGTKGMELWKTNGTDATTEIVADINPWGDFDDNGYGVNMVVLNNALYFMAYHPQNEYQLWTSDGTFDGTKMLKEINPNGSAVDWNNQGQIVVAGSNIFFNAYDDNDYALWKSDGTPEGTMLVDTEYNAYGPYNITSVGSLVSFVAYNNNTNSDWELWLSDGTAEGTVEVADVYAGSSSSDISSVVNMNNEYLAFRAQDEFKGYELWRYNLPSVINIASLGSAICAGNLINVSYTVTQGLLNSGNDFTVELSDGLGDFTNATTVGTLPNTNSTTGTIEIMVPAGTSGLGYKIRVSANDQPSLMIDGANTIPYVVADAPVSIWGNTAYCAGTPTELSATGAVSYVWSGAATGTSNTISVETAGALTVTSTDKYGCTKATVATITQDATPTITVSGVTTYCAGESTTLVASGATTYSWSPTTGVSDANAAEVLVNAANSTTYIVTGTAAACTGTAQVNIVVDPCGSGLGVEETSVNGVTVYPNPVSGSLTVQLTSNNQQTTTLKLINAQGMLVYTETVSSTNVSTIDMSKQAKGIYWLQAITNNGTTTSKIVVE